MPRDYDIRVKFRGPCQGAIEVVRFKPKQQAIPVRLVGSVANRPVMMLDIEAV
jgi:hypothetical protein